MTGPYELVDAADFGDMFIVCQINRLSTSFELIFDVYGNHDKVSDSFF